MRNTICAPMSIVQYNDKPMQIETFTLKLAFLLFPREIDRSDVITRKSRNDLVNI